MPGYGGPADRLRLDEEAVSRIAGLERKGATMPYTSRNGHMTSFLDKGGSAAVRLDEAARAEFLSRYDSGIAAQHGREMKDFVVVPDSLLEDPVTFGEWLRRGHEWVGTLEPK